MILDTLTSIEQLAEQAKAEAQALITTEAVREVKAGELLQSAIDQGGVIHLEAGQTWNESITVSKPVTIYGHNSKIVGKTTGPAVTVALGTTDVRFHDTEFNTPFSERVLLLGFNDSRQTALDSVPKRLEFRNCRVQSYRGKRAFEVNASDVLIVDCTVLDLYSPAKLDSCCVGVLNTPGNIVVKRSVFSGGTSTVFAGGDYMKLPGVIPTNILFEDLNISHPLEWHGNTAIPIKNLLELKTGRQVTMRNLVMSGSWKSGQDGYAFMLTPRVGGELQDLLIDNCHATDVAGFANLIGRDYQTTSPATLNATANVKILNSSAVTSKALYGGTGDAFVAGGELHDLTVDNFTYKGDGLIFEYYYGSVLDPVTGQKRDGGPMESVSITNSKFPAGSYGMRIAGYSHGSQPVPPAVNNLTVTGNTIAGASSTFKKNLPNNTFVTAVTW